MQFQSNRLSIAGDSKLTRKGQVTLPAIIRKRMNLKRGDRVTFVIEHNQVRLAQGSSPVARTAGVVNERGRPLSAEALRRRAEELIAEDVIRRTGG
jgi:AbrB family looped-hinge helix DNA binding protein